MATDSFDKPTDSRSEDPEKILDSKDPLAAAGFEDPDAGLSDAERAEIVSYLRLCVTGVSFARIATD
jgi:hypothetical protein